MKRRKQNKKRIKKTIALLTLTVAVFGTSMTALASSCLNVRDYGCHNSDRGSYTVKRNEVLGPDGHGNIKILVTETTYNICYCGVNYEAGINQYYEYVPF